MENIFVYLQGFYQATNRRKTEKKRRGFAKETTRGYG